jgi:hypothetical protein
MNSFRGGRKGISQELCWEPLEAGTKNWRLSSKRSRVSRTLYTSRIKIDSKLEPVPQPPQSLLLCLGYDP